MLQILGFLPLGLKQNLPLLRVMSFHMANQNLAVAHLRSGRLLDL